MPLYRIHWNGAAMFVKEEEFFQQQRREDPKWGMGPAMSAWHSVEAADLETAREVAQSLQGRGQWPPKGNYEAYTLDGSLLAVRDTAQKIGDWVADYLERGTRPYLGFTFSNGHFRYTTWKRVDGVTVGTQHTTYDEVVAWWNANRN